MINDKRNSWRITDEKYFYILSTIVISNISRKLLKITFLIFNHTKKIKINQRTLQENTKWPPNPVFSPRISPAPKREEQPPPAPKARRFELFSSPYIKCPSPSGHPLLHIVSSNTISSARVLCCIKILCTL